MKEEASMSHTSQKDRIIMFEGCYKEIKIYQSSDMSDEKHEVVLCNSNDDV